MFLHFWRTFQKSRAVFSGSSEPDSVKASLTMRWKRCAKQGMRFWLSYLAAATMFEPPSVNKNPLVMLPLPTQFVNCPLMVAAVLSAVCVYLRGLTCNIALQ